MAVSERRPGPPAAVARDALHRLIDGFQTLVREHLALAKVELKEDLGRMARNIALSATGVPPLFVGYVLLMVSLALLLALVVPSWLAFLIVAALNLAAGGLLTAVFGSKARHERLELPRTAQELKRDREWLASLVNGAAAHDRPMEPVASGRIPAGDTEGDGREQRGDGPADAGAFPPSGPHRDAMPAGKAGATPSLDPRSADPTPGHPVAGATSTEDGEPMTAERRDVTH